MNFSLHAWLDRIGIAGAGLCTVHCAALPLLLVSMPLSVLSIGSRGSWQHELAWWVMRLHGYERLLVAAALVLAALSLGMGWLRHRRMLAVTLGAGAAGCLVGGLLLRAPLALHMGLLIMGGLLLGLSHGLNLRLLHACTRATA